MLISVKRTWSPESRTVRVGVPQVDSRRTSKILIDDKDMDDDKDKEDDKDEEDIKWFVCGTLIFRDQKAKASK